MSLSVRQFGQLIGAATVSGMAERLGVITRPLSVRDMILGFGLPQQQTLQLGWLEGEFPKHFVNHPPNSTSVPVTVDGGVLLQWDDPGRGSQRASTAWTLKFRKGNGSEKIFSTTFPGVTEGLDFNTAYTWSVVPENQFGKGPPSPTFMFVTEAGPQPIPQPTPEPIPPPNLVGISKLSLFNCQIERHTVFVWVRDVTGSGPWGQIQMIPSQFNASDQCPFDDNGILADSEAILTKNGEGGGFVCTSGNVYQVSIVDPERPTCDGRNDPTVGNCVVEDRPSFFKFHLDGDEATVMLENGRLSPVPR